MQLVLSVFDIALIAMVVGAVTVLALLLGWLMGVKQKKIKTHHLAVYSAVVLQLLVTIFWMIPRSLWFISLGILSDPIGNWYIILHDIIGFTALGLGLVLSLIFLIKSGTPPKLVKSTRRLMMITLVLWLIAFVLGIVNFIVGYVA
jgi:uncharacterized membrane protein YozB (DUF420 family)